LILLEYSLLAVGDMQGVVSWTATPCTVPTELDVSEEHVACIFRVDE
jgi:hypothetical protein